MEVWAIKRYSEVFENAASRKCDDPTYTCLPLSQASEVFVELMQTREGAATFGHFIAIVQIMGTLGKDMRRLGFLVSNGRALGPVEVARRIRTPIKPFQKSWDSLSSTQVGWLYKTQYEPSSAVSDPQSSSIQNPVKNDGLVTRARALARALPACLPAPLVPSVSSPESEARANSPPLPPCGRFNPFECDPIRLAYPKQVKAQATRREIDAALCAISVRPGMDEVKAIAWLTKRVQAYAAAVNGQPGQYIPDPPRWFADGRYDDDDAAWKRDEDGPTRTVAPLSGERF